jgi:NADH-quinone oxidoreductase subunit L
MLYAAAVFSPLLGALIAGLGGKFIGDRAAQFVTVSLMILASICGVTTWWEHVYGGAGNSVVQIATWFNIGGFDLNWALHDDTLSVTMVAMVTCIATLIHIYSIGYMSHDSTIWRFFSYLSLFTFAMLMLVSADNLVQLFFGWEGVGLASYLLIGYWYEKPSACAAAIKAMIVNRVGDLAFALGIALVFVTFGAVDFGTIFGNIQPHIGDSYHLFGSDLRAFEVIGVLLFIGAMGKSAQLFLHTWLPDAMEGPTPVSALIHAATMVTAGVFLMARMSPLMEFAPHALAMVTFIGASTCLFAATIGCVQNDIKRVIAYSTCSQLGYMFMAAGVGAYQASVFHLFTHAFFKALLFLSAGSVIHAMSDEQDMRRMGGIWKKIPVTYAMMWIGNLALAGIPPFAGYYSKDAILEAAFTAGGIGTYGFVCGSIAAFLTAFYSWRLLFMTFHGKSRADQHVQEHVHESPFVMLAPLLLLASGAVLTGMVFHGKFIGAGRDAYWQGAIFNGPDNHVLENMEHLPALIGMLPTLVGLAGIALAIWFYLLAPSIPAKLAAQFGPVYRFLLNKWYFDELYDFIFVKPAKCIGRALWQIGDATLIDGVPNGLARLVTDGASEAVKLQTGSIAIYAFTMLIGVAGMVGLFLVMR